MVDTHCISNINYLSYSAMNFDVPLGSTVSHVRPRFAYSYTSSIIRHAQNQAGVSPPRPNPPCTK